MFNYRCNHCEEDTPHVIQFNEIEDNGYMISKVKCSKCSGPPFHLKYPTGSMPMYESQRVLFPACEIIEIKERTRKDFMHCDTCKRKRWGKKNVLEEHPHSDKVSFTCSVCQNVTTSTIPVSQRNRKKVA